MGPREQRRDPLARTSLPEEETREERVGEETGGSVVRERGMETDFN